MRVDEYRDGNTQVIRAEMPGMEPRRDASASASPTGCCTSPRNGGSREEETQDLGWTRHELQYGSFSRSLPLPEGANPSDVSASYRHGILEIRIPVREPVAADPVQIPVRKGSTGTPSQEETP